MLRLRPEGLGAGECTCHPSPPMSDRPLSVNILRGPLCCPAPRDSVTSQKTPLRTSEGLLFLGCTGLFRARIPEHLVAVFADILHPATDLQQGSGILPVARTHRFRAHSLETSRKCVKTCAVLLDQRGDLGRLKLDARRLRL